jgi:hypothetical protein
MDGYYWPKARIERPWSQRPLWGEQTFRMVSLTTAFDPNRTFRTLWCQDFLHVSGSGHSRMRPKTAGFDPLPLFR